MATVIPGNILDIHADFIVQQCNCLTVEAHGLSAAIATRFPWADPYAKRVRVGKRNLATPGTRAMPGSVQWMESDPNPATSGTVVACIYGQWRPGAPGAPYWHRYPEWSALPGEEETAQTRLAWFRIALECMVSMIASFSRLRRRVVTVAFPWRIGCGLAGGDWAAYRPLIDAFAEQCRDFACVTIVQQQDA